MVFSRYAALPLLLIFAFSPTIAAAQSASTTTTDAGMTPVLRQMFRGWRQSSELQQKIAALGSTPVLSLPMPVLFGVGLRNISPNFGDPRDGGARTHEGEDIMAVKGTPVVSPTVAVVIRTGVGSGQGNYVTTANPGGETFVYMHLDRFGEGVAAGAVLAQGELIGYVGNTGNASGGAAHLHFEVHNSSGTPTDPYPRLTAEFTPVQKISFLITILTQTSDPIALSQFLVANFRSTFTSDAQSGITLPPLITGALATVANVPPLSIADSYLPTGDLELGSSGSAVVSLQQFLIAKATGPAAARLIGAGATGNFGPITQAALIEYQIAAGISPANGYYGPATRAAVQGTPAGNTTPLPGNIPTPSGNTTTLPGSNTSGTSTGGTVAIARNLYLGVSGQDVLTLQKFLNAHGFTVAASGAGSIGQETTYFGPATQAAVIRFQIAHSISPAVGYVGTLSRTALAS